MSWWQYINIEYRERIMTCINVDDKKKKNKIITFLTINTGSYSDSLLVLIDNNTMIDTTEQIMTSENETMINNIFAIDNTKIANNLIVIIIINKCSMDMNKRTITITTTTQN